MSTAAKYVEKIQILSRDYSNAVREARNHADEHLTAEGLRVEREGRLRYANDYYGRQLGALRAQMEHESHNLKSRAARSVPAKQGSTRDAWERVRMLLDAGQPLNEVIAKADVGSLHAIQEWAPAWIDATTKGKITDLGPFERSITQRWAEIAPDPAPVREFLDSSSDIAVFEQMAGSLADKCNGGSLSFGVGTLAEAFAATSAGQQASVDLSSFREPGSLGVLHE